MKDITVVPVKVEEHDKHDEQNVKPLIVNKNLPFMNWLIPLLVVLIMIYAFGHLMKFW